tara:strand:- start:723 stop:1049 length:327 start_codon:yes stop_codon:yes gene_type:complete
MILHFYRSPSGSLLSESGSNWNTAEENKLLEKLEDNFLKLFKLGSFSIPREQAKQIRESLQKWGGDSNEDISIGKVFDSHGREQFYITLHDTEKTLFFEIDSRNKQEG